MNMPRHFFVVLSKDLRSVINQQSERIEENVLFTHNIVGR